MRPIGLVLAFALPLAALQAQSAVPDSGDRVRIHVTDPRMSWVFTGTLVFLDDDSLTLVEQLKDGRVADSTRVGAPADMGAAGRRISVARSQVTRMEMSAGLHSRVGSGALIGAGAGVGAALLEIALLCAGSDIHCPEDGGQVVAVTVTNVLFGAAVGAIKGLFNRREEWVTAGEGPRASVMLRPSEKGAAMGLAITY